MSLHEENEVINAEFVDDDGGALVLVEEPDARLVVHKDTVLYPGQELPTAGKGPRYTERDLYVSVETAAALRDTDPEDTGPVKAFKAWCAEQQGRVAVPCITATFTEWSRHLMERGLKVSTIKNYMSLIRTAMPPGKNPDHSLDGEAVRVLLQRHAKNTEFPEAWRLPAPVEGSTR
ncbi:hypothetical protein [Streptomyces sp. A30]|uniref:hypothetical protein n=1 Tax=Streptomyces sp. A30 TaxID=2789273 RepID=UPI00397F7AF2